MTFSRFSLFRLVAGLVGLVLAPLLAQAQIVADGGTVGASYSYPVVVNPAPESPVYSATGLPGGLAINASSGVISGTPTTAGTFVGTVFVTSNGDTNSGSITITIAAASGTPVISSATTAAGNVGDVFTYTATATLSPTSFNITGLPSGLTVTSNGATATISGTPVAIGTSSVTISANNLTGTGSPVTLTITIGASTLAPVINNTTTSYQIGVGDAFSHTISATNTPTSYAASGLPVGVNIDTTSGVISGNPSVAGIYTIATTATNGSGTSAAVNVTLTVGTLSNITSALTANTASDQVFNYTVTADNSPTSYNITGLPAGLSVTSNAATATISGTPTFLGASSISLSANNATGQGPSKTLTLSVGNRPAVNSPLTKSGTKDVALSYTISGTNTPSSYGATGLPAGLTLNSTSGVISGAATVAGTFNVGLTATNAFGTSNSATLVLTIGEVPAISGSFAASATVGSAFTYTITASNAPTSYAATGLPAGLTLNTTSGVISGTPTTAGTASVSLTATNAFGTSTAATLTITVGNRPVIGGTLAASATVGSAFTYTITASNSPTSYAATGLPAGLTLNTTSGVISGTPTTAGTASVSLTATNAFGTSTAATLTITVSSGIIATSISAQPQTKTVDAGTAATLSVTGNGSGTLTYQWKKNGVDIAGATSATLTLANPGRTDMGSYSVTVTGTGGSVTSDAAKLTVNYSRMINMSVRSSAGSGAATLIVGFGIDGDEAFEKQTLIRGIGPELAEFELTTFVVDPSIALYDSDRKIIDSNEDWGGTEQLKQVSSRVGAFPLSKADSKDAVLYRTLSGTGGPTVTYTAHIGAPTGPGIALVEAYDADPEISSARLVNVSARTPVGTGADSLFVGFVISGPTPKKVLIRGIGPSLAAFGVDGVLVDPQLEVFDNSNKKFAENDNWGGTEDLKKSFVDVGAFGFASDSSKDAGIILTLAPGRYTAQLSGVGGATGVGMIEVYDVP